VAKRTGKTHENLENELTPPLVARRAPDPEPARPRPAVTRPARADRSGPIGISGGDFATPSARKRTTTQPRGLPALQPPAAATNGTPPPVARADGAQPESPFGASVATDLGDAASQLAAEAAAVRALDSGPLTPPPTLNDPGPTPPPQPIAAEMVPVLEETPTPPPELVAPPLVTEASWFPEPPVEVEVPVLEPPAPEPSALPGLESSPAAEVEAHEDRFSAQETPWPELSHQGAALRAPTPPPGAIPNDSMGADNAVERETLDVAGATPTALDEAAIRHPDDAELAGVDDLEVVDGTEALDTLPAEALAETSTAPSSDVDVPLATPPPMPRPAAAPPPIPAGSPRRKTGEMRAPEVPTAQVLASIVPVVQAGATNLPEALAQRPRRPKRSKPWFEEVFDEDYLRTLPFMSADQTLREVEFIEASLGVKPGGQVLDIGCGYGRHAIELVQRGLDVTGLDLSLPLLLRAADEAQKRAMSVNFVHADMREMAFETQFDGVYCMLTSFGYFDEDTNLRVAEGIARALKPGGRLLLDLVNRDYIVGDLPSRVWWEGNGCVVLEEVDFNFHTSRIITHRSIVFEDGRQIEQEISVRAYSLHEIGRLLRQAGFRVLDVSGGLATRGHFFGGTSRSLLIVAEKRADETT
jgi:SAM-dependent methyltransferase